MPRRVPGRARRLRITSPRRGAGKCAATCRIGRRQAARPGSRRHCAARSAGPRPRGAPGPPVGEHLRAVQQGLCQAAALGPAARHAFYRLDDHRAVDDTVTSGDQARDDRNGIRDDFLAESVPYWPNTLDGYANDYVTNYLPAGAFADEEISVTGSAGTLFSFRTDMVHRASGMTAERSARFTLLAHYDVWGPRWTGRVAWPARSLSPDWGELIEKATPRERSVFGFPDPGDPYWDEQTLADTQARYPGADLTPYR